MYFDCCVNLVYLLVTDTRITMYLSDCLWLIRTLPYICLIAYDRYTHYHVYVWLLLTDIRTIMYLFDRLWLIHVLSCICLIASDWYTHYHVCVWLLLTDTRTIMHLFDRLWLIHELSVNLWRLWHNKLHQTVTKDITSVTDTLHFLLLFHFRYPVF